MKLRLTLLALALCAACNMPPSSPAPASTTSPAPTVSTFTATVAVTPGAATPTPPTRGRAIPVPTPPPSGVTKAPPPIIVTPPPVTTTPPPPPPPDPSTYEDCAKYGSDVHLKFSVDQDGPTKGQFHFYGIVNIYVWEDATVGKYSKAASSFTLDYFPRGYFKSYDAGQIASHFGLMSTPTPRCGFGGTDFTGIVVHQGGKPYAYHRQRLVYPVTTATKWDDAFLAAHPEAASAVNSFITVVRNLRDVRGYPFQTKPFSAAGNNCTRYPCQ